MEVRIHATYTAQGYLETDAVSFTLYWSTRLLDAIGDTRKYEVMGKTLRTILWERFRVLDDKRKAISVSGIAELVAWADLYLPRLSDKYAQESQELKNRIRAIVIDAHAAKLAS